MQKLLLVLFSASIGSALTVIVMESHATAGSGQGGGVEECASRNGDVNADGRVDLSDAVTILGNLFLGNPSRLVPLCEPPRQVTGLPDTGLATCYGLLEDPDFEDINWIQVPCDSAPCTSGQDASHATGCPNDGRFTDNGDGTVIDHCTGLMWQQDTADVNGSGQTTTDDYLPWCIALSYCESLTFAGHNDWRLPNVRELESIVDYGRMFPSIDPAFQSITGLYWSSTSIAAVPEPDDQGVRGRAWVVYFAGGGVGVGNKVDNGFVRAVRNAP